MLFVFWLNAGWLFLVSFIFFVFLTINPGRFLIYFINAKVLKNQDFVWEIQIPNGSNILEADQCFYDSEEETLIFMFGRKKITLGYNDLYYLLLYLFVRKLVRCFPVNSWRFLFLPLAVVLYFYQITAKAFLVSGDMSEELPSLVLNRDILTLLRV